MRGTLIGTDYLHQGDDIKVLEINTNSGVFNTGVEYLQLNSLFEFLVRDSYTELHFIFSEDLHVGGPENTFLNTLEQMSIDNNITFVKHEVESGAITIPNVEDTTDRFILRQAFDASAIVDSLYCNDKMEFLSLMSGSNYTPKSYFSSSDGFYMNEYTDINTDIPSDMPNTVVKARYPAYDMKKYPQIKRCADSQSLESNINNLESEDYIIQEYIFDNENFKDGRNVSMRTFDIIYGHNLDVIHLGGYKMSSLVPLSFESTSFEEDGETYDKLSRLKFISKGLQTTTYLTYHTDDESDILTESGVTNVANIQLGDDIKTILFDMVSGSEMSGEPNPDYINHYGTLTLTSESLAVATSSLQSISSQSFDTLFVKATFSDGTSMIDSPTSEIYIIESGSTETTRFEFVNKLLVGDSVVYFNSGSEELTTREITNLEMIWQNDIVVYNLDFEPFDYFLVDSKNADGTYAIMHNICTYCGYSWAPCGNYYCDFYCLNCAGGGGKPPI